MEQEVNGRISFLDVLVSKAGDRFSTSVFRKETFSGLGSSYFSFCPTIFKINAIKTLVHRAYHVCSNFNLLHKEFQFLISYFRKNGFSTKLVESCIQKFLDSKYKVQDGNNSKLQKLYFSFPYFGQKSLKLKEELDKLFKKHFPDVGMVLIFANKYKIGSLFNFKDKIPDFMQSSLVYKYRCAQCASEYVGSSSRSLCVRVSEHKGISNRTGKILSSAPHSNIREHSENCDSPIKSECFQKIAICKNNTDLRILESLYINRLKPTLNSMQSAHPLYLIR